MDALKTDAHQNNEDIIELTDIIEKGTPKNSQGAHEASQLSAQLNDLFSENSGRNSMATEVDADIEALLSQIESDQAPLDAPQNQQDGNLLNPNEKLDMPGMAEVDSLLQGLDIPPQPEGDVTSGVAAADDLDALLAGILDSPVGSEARPQAAPAVDPIKELNALPGNAPVAVQAPGQDDDPLADLDALMGTDQKDPPAEQPRAAPAVAPTSDPMADDQDVLLAGVAPPTKSLAATPPKESDALLMDLDALLGGATPEPALESSIAMPDANGLDINTLDALFSPQNTTEERLDDDTVPDISDLAGLDELLAPKKHSLMSDLATNVDKSILDSFAEVARARMEEGPEAPEMGSLENELHELDALLGVVPSLEETASFPSENLGPPDISHVVDGNAMLEPALLPVAAVTIGSAALATTATVATSNPSISLMPQDTAPPLPEAGKSWRNPLPVECEMQECLPPMDGFSSGELRRATEELLHEKVMLEATTKDVDAGMWMHNLDEALEESYGDRKPVMEAAVENLLREGSPLYNSFARIVRTAIAEEMHQHDAPAKAPTIVAALTVLEERLAGMEERFSGMAERIAGMETRPSVMEERIMVLEERLHDAEALWTQKLDQAAATAAARIIREEIAALLQPEQ